MPLTPGPQVLDFADPVSDDPDNYGLSLWLLGLPEVPGVAGGSKLWPDLTGKLGPGPRYTTGGSLVNGPAWVGTPFGQSGVSTLGASSQEVACGPVLSGTVPSLTIAFWGYRAVTSDFLAVGWGDTNAFRFNVLVWTDGNVYVQFENNGNVGSQAVAWSLAGWHRFVWTLDGSVGQSRLYVDGVKLGTAGAGVAGYAVTGNFRVGSEPANGRYSTGRYADIQVLAAPASDGWAARDYGWSQDPRRDPRLRWFTPKVWSFGGATAGGAVTVGLSPVTAAGVLTGTTVTVGDRVTPTALTARGVQVGPQVEVGVTIFPAPLAANGVQVGPAVRVSDAIVLSPVPADGTITAQVVTTVTGVLTPAVAAHGVPVPPAATTGVVLTLPVSSGRAVPVTPTTAVSVITILSPAFALGGVVSPKVAAGTVVGLPPLTGHAAPVGPVVTAVYRVSPTAVAGAGVTVAPVIAVATVVSLAAVSARGMVTPPVVVGGVLLLPPGDAGEFFTKPVEYAARTFFKPEEYAARVFWSDPTVPAPTETRYMTDKENKTFGFSFEKEGSVRDGEALSDPQVFVDPAGPILGVPEVVDADFHDSDGRRIRANKGVKVRVAEAAAGTYTLTCRVSTPSDPALEWAGTLQVDASLGD